jgi:serine/threonine protein kinase
MTASFRPDAQDQRFSEVLAAYLEAIDAGWAPERRTFLARYPDLASELEAYFASQDDFAQVAQSLPRPPLAHGGTREGFRGGSLEAPTLPEWDVPTPATFKNGTVPFGDYELLEEIARGGMGIVFKARQRSLNRLVALKMIRAGQLASPAEVQSFLTEAENAARLDHPNIVPIYEVGEHQSRHYFTMKLIEGGNLGEHVPRLSKDLKAAVRMLATVARAVHHAHQRGVLHRDLKPANVLLDAQGQPHVTDFGLAKRMSAESQPEAAGSPTDGWLAKGVTASSIAGTPGYMPPEQAAGPNSVLTTAADVYSLGAILYVVLTGKRPFWGSTRLDVQSDEAPTNTPEGPRLLNPKVDLDLEAICLKCLNKTPDQRYSSARALAEDLERWLRREPVQARPRPWPDRAWRAICRNALLSLVMALAGFGLATWAVLPALNDPDRPLKKMERELARGESVTLIGEAGRPKWYRWGLGEDKIMMESVAPDKPYSFMTPDFGRLFLLNSPRRSHYRFSAEVRHDSSFDMGEAGLLFAHGPHAGGSCWCELTFADRGKAAHRVPGAEAGEVRLTLKRFADRPTPGKEYQFLSAVRKRFTPAEDRRGETDVWRQLAIEVTPEGLEAFWECKSIGKLSRDTLLESSMMLELRPPAPPFAFAPEGALGLYVFQGMASFRRVVVEPLP